MKVLVLYDQPRFTAQITYTFDALLSTLGLDYELSVWLAQDSLWVRREYDLAILYGRDTFGNVSNRRKLHIFSSDFFGPDYLKDTSLPKLPLDWVLVEGNRMPVLYNANQLLSGKTLLATKGGIQIATFARKKEERLVQTNLDLVAASFFMLSRYQEALSHERDQFDRFPLQADLAFQEGFWREPIVNLYANLLNRWIEILIGGECKSEPSPYPRSHTFGLCLTHDVDHPKKFTLAGLVKTPAKVALRRESPEALRQMKAFFISRQDPFWNFDHILSLEQMYDFKSTFFIVAGRHHPRDPSYGNDHKQRRRLCKAVLVQGGEVGLHGSFGSHLDVQVLEQELTALRQHAPIIGVRQHYLRLDTQRSFKVMEGTELLYDCTLGFSGELGFRSGFAAPHYLFNLAENYPFRILEIPLLIMDRSLWTLYSELSPETVWQEMLSVLRWVRDCNGCMSILWHNGFFDEAAFPGYADLYRALLEWLRENNGWGATGAQVHQWFTSRKACKSEK